MTQTNISKLPVLIVGFGGPLWRIPGLLQIKGRVSAGMLHHRAEGDARSIANESGYAQLSLRGAPNGEKGREKINMKIEGCVMSSTWSQLTLILEPTQNWYVKRHSPWDPIKNIAAG